MEYFIITSDERVENPLSFTVEESKITSMKPFVINIGETNEMDVMDMVVVRILFNSYYLLSDELMKVFRMYDNSIESVPIFISSDDRSIQESYWCINMEVTEDVVTNEFLKVEDMIVNEDCIKDKPIHIVQYEKQSYLLVNQYVAESILRRMPVGLWFQRVTVLKGEN